MPELTPVERMASAVPILSMRQINSKKQETQASTRCTGLKSRGYVTIRDGANSYIFSAPKTFAGSFIASDSCYVFWG